MDAMLATMLYMLWGEMGDHAVLATILCMLCGGVGGMAQRVVRCRVAGVC